MLLPAVGAGVLTARAYQRPDAPRGDPARGARHLHDRRHGAARRDVLTRPPRPADRVRGHARSFCPTLCASCREHGGQGGATCSGAAVATVLAGCALTACGRIDPMAAGSTCVGSTDAAGLPDMFGEVPGGLVRRRLPTRHAAPRRAHALALPGRVDRLPPPPPPPEPIDHHDAARIAAASTRRAGDPSRAQCRTDPERAVLRPAPQWLRQRSPALVVPRRDRTVLPLVLAARRHDRRRRASVRLRRRDGGTRTALPVDHRTDRHPCRRRRRRHDAARRGGAGAERQTRRCTGSRSRATPAGRTSTPSATASSDGHRRSSSSPTTCRVRRT